VQLNRSELKPCSQQLHPLKNSKLNRLKIRVNRQNLELVIHFSIAGCTDLVTGMEYGVQMGLNWGMKSVEIGTILRQTLPLFLTAGIVEMGANALFFLVNLLFSCRVQLILSFQIILKIRFPIFNPGSYGMSYWQSDLYQGGEILLRFYLFLLLLNLGPPWARL